MLLKGLSYPYFYSLLQPTNNLLYPTPPWSACWLFRTKKDSCRTQTLSISLPTSIIISSAPISNTSHPLHWFCLLTPSSPPMAFSLLFYPIYPTKSLLKARFLSPTKVIGYENRGDLAWKVCLWVWGGAGGGDVPSNISYERWNATYLGAGILRPIICNLIAREKFKMDKFLFYRTGRVSPFRYVNNNIHPFSTSEYAPGSWANFFFLIKKNSSDHIRQNIGEVINKYRWKLKIN